MKISFLSDAESEVNVFPELAVKIKQEIADIEIEEVFVPKKEDLPKKALDLAPETDLIFVLSLYPEKTTRIEMILEKLIDVEIKTGVSIVKAFEDSEVFDLESEEEIELEKEALVEKWSKFLVNLLFHPDEFVPKK